ncbi:MAG TPA: hypothetical protein VFV49_05815 [Thermoanaerobaculia bacterium]|nr:hypothetical protein [Thermoanaerobaculia bacterium]
MRATFLWLTWVGRGSLVATIAISAFAVSAFGASSTVLFPKPLHLVRTIEDPLARGTSTVHEYCVGNQVITVNGSRVAVADYDKQQLTEIDREAGTYSVTPFEELAKANANIRGGGGVATSKASKAPKSDSAAGAVKPETWKATQLGVRGAAGGRSVDAWQLVRGDARDKTTIEIGVDRRIALSRDAVEVLVGASYPNTRREEHDALLRAASGPAGTTQRQPMANSVGNSAPSAQYGLPVEQILTFESAGERVEVRNTVREVNEELPPANLLIIPPGSQLVESRTVRMARELRELDELPGQSPRP